MGMWERTADSSNRFLFAQDKQGPLLRRAAQQILIWRQNREASWAGSYHFVPLSNGLQAFNTIGLLKSWAGKDGKRENKTQMHKRGEWRTTLDARQKIKRARKLCLKLQEVNLARV